MCEQGLVLLKDQGDGCSGATKQAEWLTASHACWRRSPGIGACPAPPRWTFCRCPQASVAHRKRKDSCVQEALRDTGRGASWTHTCPSWCTRGQQGPSVPPPLSSKPPHTPPQTATCPLPCPPPHPAQPRTCSCGFQSECMFFVKWDQHVCTERLLNTRP